MKCLCISLLAAALFCQTSYVSAELPPTAYRRYVERAPEKLTIVVVDVDKWFSRVTVEAKVVEIKETATALQVGQTIIIKYDYRPLKAGMVGPSPIPVLKEHAVYPAYLHKGAGKNYYLPAARGKSFSRDPLIAPQVDTHVRECFQTIYFDYDSSVVRESERPKIDLVAACLERHPTLKLIAAGHTDERGTEEYNFMQGERQAQAVKALLVERGVDAERLKVLSYSEFMPVDEGHDVSAWAKNRWVELLSAED